MRDRSTHVDWLRIDDVAKHALANAQLPASGTFTRTIAAQIVDHGSGQARMRRREVASEHFLGARAVVNDGSLARRRIRGPWTFVQNGRASCRANMCQSVLISVVGGTL